MWTTILGVGKAVLGWLGGLLGDLYRWAAVFLAYRLGKRAARQEAAEKALDTAARARRIDEDVGNLTDAERDRWLRGPGPDE